LRDRAAKIIFSRFLRRGSWKRVYHRHSSQIKSVQIGTALKSGISAAIAESNNEAVICLCLYHPYHNLTIRGQGCIIFDETRPTLETSETRHGTRETL